MSLNVYLIRKKWVSYDEGKTHTEENEEVYCANITHNLTKMAEKAGIYEALWHPYRLNKKYNIPVNDFLAQWKFEDENKIFAKDIVAIIEIGLSDMKAKPEYYKQFNASNGYGLYEYFIPWIEKYLEACKQYPDATVEVSR